MRKLRICIGSNDSENIARSHMGDTKNFHICEIDDASGIKMIETRENNAKDLDHSTEGKMKKILEIVSDTDILVAWQMSQNFLNISKKTRFQPVIVKAEKIEDVLKVLQRVYKQLEELVDKRKEGFFSKEVPEFD